MLYDLSSKKAFIFDFDGVILDSEQYKLQSYPKLFTEYPEHLEEIKEYINGAAGVNRFKKFKRISEIMGKEYTDEEGDRLSEEYDNLTTSSLKELPLVAGIEEFLMSSEAKKFIASSTPIDKLEEIVIHKGISK